MKRTSLKRPTLAQVQAWQNRPKTPIKRMSAKRQRERPTYLKLRAIFLEDNPLCQVENCLNHATELHHKRGRVGKNFLDTSTFMAVCCPCHVAIHQNPVVSRNLGYMFPR